MNKKILVVAAVLMVVCAAGAFAFGIGVQGGGGYPAAGNAAITFKLDSQKKSGFRSFAYSILFNFQVSFIVDRFALVLSSESLSVTAYLLYHTVFRLSSTFLKFFEKVF